jgi:hypothetical protein
MSIQTDYRIKNLNVTSPVQINRNNNSISETDHYVSPQVNNNIRVNNNILS